MSVCPRCQAQRQPEDQVCPACGWSDGGDAPSASGNTTQSIPVIPASREVEPELAALAADVPVGQAVLVLLSQPAAGSRFLIANDAVTIGRHRNANVFLDDITVSRRHALITCEATQFRLSDAGSLNGTYVNGLRVDDVVLHSGDHLQFGRFRLVFLHGTASH